MSSTSTLLSKFSHITLEGIEAGCVSSEPTSLPVHVALDEILSYWMPEGSYVVGSIFVFLPMACTAMSLS